jgi:hypothetical protein
MHPFSQRRGCCAIVDTVAVAVAAAVDVAVKSRVIICSDHGGIHWKEYLEGLSDSSLY